MIEFEEADAKYDFDETKGKSDKVKIRVITMFIIFLMVIFMLIKNDFNFNFLQTSLASVPQQCNPLYSYDPEDSQQSAVQNAKYILNENIMEFGRIEGFSNAFVVEGETAEIEKKQIPEIRLEFNELAQAGKQIPQNLCGFKVSVVYK
jgi:hypothetical protein